MLPGANRLPVLGGKMMDRKITKTITMTYAFKVFPAAWKMKQGEFLERRKRLGLSTKKFERCFCCGKELLLDDVPIFIQVEHIGNRFACKKCAEIEEGKTNGQIKNRVDGISGGD